jgi:uncharacterized protein (TIGR00661 family)
MKKPKILYAIQGTGNGHVARAREVIPLLQKYAEVDVLISGNQSEIALPVEPKYSFKGITMAYNKNGGVSYSRSLVVNNPIIALKEIISLPVKNYNLVISDFESITSWACKLKGKSCLAVSHQSAMVSKRVPQPLKKSKVGRLILKYYAPATDSIGFHFKPYDSYIYSPIIRSEIRALKIESETKNLYSVYLPSYTSDFLIKVFQRFEYFTFVVFSKDARMSRTEGNVNIEPIENTMFIETLKACAGVLTGAGFETPSEVLFLKKKLLVIPIAKQYEQLMNAKALEEMGVEVLYDLEEASIAKIDTWLKTDNTIEVDFPDETEDIIKNKILPFAK